MMNKILLAAIALGLWANAAATFVRPAHAEFETQDSSVLANIESDLQSIESAVRALAIGGRGCRNKKICD